MALLGGVSYLLFVGYQFVGEYPTAALAWTRVWKSVLPTSGGTGELPAGTFILTVVWSEDGRDMKVVRAIELKDEIDQFGTISYSDLHGDGLDLVTGFSVALWKAQGEGDESSPTT